MAAVLVCSNSVPLKNCFRFARAIGVFCRTLHRNKSEPKYNDPPVLKGNRSRLTRRMSEHFSTTADRSSSSLDLSGIFPPIVTPFEENEEISYERLTENFAKWNNVPFRGEKIGLSSL